MKTLAKTFSAIIFAGIIFSASAQNRNYDDDIYYTPSDDIYQPANSNLPTPEKYTSGNNSEQQNNSGSNQQSGNVINNYGTYNDYSSDDYYDYAYAARLRRFHNPIYSYGYYDPWYTNMYWYDYNPYYYGTSIYLGYSWWHPRPWGGWNIGWNSYYGWNIGWNWGWGVPYGYGCGYGYYGMSYYNPYNNAYWNGYNNGYYNGLYASNNYYNSYDANSYYYGHRNSTSSNGGRSNRSLAENYQNTVGEKAFNSKFAEVPKGVAKSVEPLGIPDISSEPRGGNSVSPIKESSTVIPDRGKSTDINNYNTPKGLNQEGGNVRGNSSGIGTEKEIQPTRNSDFGNTNFGKDYSQPKNETNPTRGNKSYDDYSSPKEPKGNRGNYESKPNFEKYEQPKNVSPSEPKNNPKNDAPKQSSPRGGYNAMPENSASKSSSPSYGGNNGGGKMSSPNFGGGSSGSGNRGGGMSAPSGGGGRRK